ncbi:MAG: hypothetical protein LUD18_01985 [Lachnospiraceae bacterium]|nr:hypothetical protein [Lachnospiraceae bacterium]
MKVLSSYRAFCRSGAVIRQRREERYGEKGEGFEASDTKPADADASVCFFSPILILLCALFAVMISYVNQYTSILHNVTTASEFNQDFKENIDLKMYYYVVGSHYSDGLPIEEVEAAQELARGLLETTTQYESWKAINGVLQLCENLEEKIYLIEATDNYDDRQTQLENNIYVLTELIQEYMYNYLYYEASLLDALQTEMMRNLWFELGLIAVVALALMLLSLWRFFAFCKFDHEAHQ